MIKKICIITPTFLPKTGGSQIGIFNIAKKLADLKKEMGIFKYIAIYERIRGGPAHRRRVELIN